MTELEDGHDRRGRRDWLALALVLVFGACVYAWGVPSRPAGFHLDESSVAFNAHLIAETGRDEHGARAPLFFRAFGEYKNPVYIYLLAAVFKVTGPSVAAARLLSAAMGVAAALVLGLLARRVTRRREALWVAAVTALLTPWLFELSRLVFEVALFPLALALFLLWLHHAAGRARWTWADVAGLAALLALITYTYSIGRLLGPLLALGLALFLTKERLARVLSVWALYALTVVPAVVFHLRYPGALTGRFRVVSYLEQQATWGEAAREFVKRYAANLDPWRMFLTGDPDPNQLTQIEGCGLVLALTGALAAVGLWRFVREKRGERWWRYVVYGLLVAPIPASLTRDVFHTLRLSPLFVFVFALGLLGLEWFLAAAARRRRTTLVAASLTLLALAQGAVLLWRFHTEAPNYRRVHFMDVEYAEKIFAPALAVTARPVFLADATDKPGYVQAYWYATLRGVPLSEFRRLADDELPPGGATVVTTEEECARCRVVAESEPYTLYVAAAPPPARAPLPESALRAELRVEQAPEVFRAGARATVTVRVRNAGDRLWLARERAAKFQVMLGNHWLTAAGATLRNDDGRAAITRDLAPGEETLMPLVVNAPTTAGDYVLEVDVLQEGVAWFGSRGSQTARVRVRVE